MPVRSLHSCRSGANFLPARGRFPGTSPVFRNKLRQRPLFQASRFSMSAATAAFFQEARLLPGGPSGMGIPPVIRQPGSNWVKVSSQGHCSRLVSPVLAGPVTDPEIDDSGNRHKFGKSFPTGPLKVGVGFHPIMNRFPKELPSLDCLSWTAGH